VLRDLVFALGLQDGQQRTASGVWTYAVGLGNESGVVLSFFSSPNLRIARLGLLGNVLLLYVIPRSALLWRE
jgi:hypothetical protein